MCKHRESPAPAPLSRLAHATWETGRISPRKRQRVPVSLLTLARWEACCCPYSGDRPAKCNGTFQQCEAAAKRCGQYPGPTVAIASSRSSRTALGTPSCNEPTGAIARTNITSTSLADAMAQAEWFIEARLAFRPPSRNERLAG